MSSNVPSTSRGRTAWPGVPDARRAVMRANRRRDTGPERALRSLLHAAGLRYRVDYPVRPSGGRIVRPDIVFTRSAVAVFVDGCFWHSCPLHASRPATNRDYWDPKLAGNRDRDERTTRALRADGWTVLRFWEHEAPEAAAQAVIAAVATASAHDLAAP